MIVPPGLILIGIFIVPPVLRLALFVLFAFTPPPPIPLLPPSPPLPGPYRASIFSRIELLHTPVHVHAARRVHDHRQHFLPDSPVERLGVVRTVHVLQHVLLVPRKGHHDVLLRAVQQLVEHRSVRLQQETERLHAHEAVTSAFAYYPR